VPIEDNGGCDTGKKVKSAQLIRLSMDKHKSAMSGAGAFVADVMVIFAGDAPWMENRDLATSPRLMNERSIPITGSCPFEAQMQGRLNLSRTSAFV